MGRKIRKGLFVLVFVLIYWAAAIIPTFGYLITLSIATYFVMNGILTWADKLFDEKEDEIEDDDYDDAEECLDETDIEYCEYCGHIKEFCVCDEEDVY